MENGIYQAERFYVPHGQTTRLENLYTDKLIVDGTLIVAKKLCAGACRGKGSVQAGDMEMDTLRLSSVTCDGSLTAREITAQRVYAESVHASKRIWCLVSLIAKFVVAPSVATPLLGCENGDIQDCVIIPQRNYSPRRFRRAVRWHRFWMRLHARGGRNSHHWRMEPQNPVEEQPFAGPAKPPAETLEHQIRQMTRNLARLDAMLREQEAHEARVQAAASAGYIPASDIQLGECAAKAA
ncbi:MAG: hypothetical protein ACLUBZ_00280 [Ruthenibacterium lactatiformans]|jgi:hypothetical protein|uniref:hypothetical protein n=1 Tax=Ruthenibacterium lactatiformans TaxID=1550024 RepID=UPI003995B188